MRHAFPIALFTALICIMATAAHAQTPLGTAFTYQGELASGGTLATGAYDMRFRLYDAASGGTQIGGTVCRDNVAINGGVFTTALDFGAVFTGDKRFLEIEVRQDTGLDCSDTSGYTVLSPRQELTATPHAAYALTAGSAATAQTANNAASLNGQSAGFYQNAANLTGTLADARLSSNVARLDGNQTFTGQTSFSNPANTFSGTFSGNGAGLLNLNGANIAAGTITRSRMGTDVERVLSQWTPLPPTATPLDAIAWGDNTYGQRNIPALPGGETYTAAAVGVAHCLALRSNGTVVAWGTNVSGQTNVPALPGGVLYTAVAAGQLFSLALRSDGTVVAWGDNTYGQTNVPALPSGVTYTAVAAGAYYSLALRSDGTVVVWSNNFYAPTNVPALPSGVTYTAVAAGDFSSIALRSDGTVVVWGSNSFGQLNVPALPGGVLYTAVAAGERHSLALRSDGTVVAWGDNSRGQLNVPALPGGVTYTAVAAGSLHSLALRSDGAVVAWGYNIAGQTTVPALPSGVTYTAVAGGGFSSLAIRGTIITPARLSSPIAVAASSFVGSGEALTNLNAANVTGTLAADRIPTLDASKITSGVLAPAQIPSLDASTITTGTLAAALIPNLDATKINTGTLAAAQIPSLDASKITTGTLANAQTTGTSLSTPSTLVLRDASGSFNAGTITASLNGNATTATTATSASNASQLNGQPASFYQDAGNLSAGLLPDARLSNNIPRLNDNALFSANLGVGVAAPLQRLHVGGSGLFGDNGIDNFAVGFDAQPNARLGFVKKSGLLPVIASAANQPIVFSQSNQGDIFTNINGATLTERMRIAANGNIQVPGGVITNGTAAIPTADLGLYSQNSFWMRFVTSNAAFQWFSDGGAGTTPRMTLSPTGNLTVSGSLAKAGGSFKIDHPLDPENKYLYHSFVESPDMMNIYNGEVTTDGTGYAVVTLPDYFQALNRDFRYQLTVIDDDDQSDALVWAKVVRRIGVDAANTFTIRTFRPNVAVSWQVTGIRKDAWAEKNRIPNSVDKAPVEKGRYLHPEAFGKPASQGVLAVPTLPDTQASKRE